MNSMNNKGENFVSVCDHIVGWIFRQGGVEWQLKEISLDALSFGMLSEERKDNVFSI
jgi:hypothetical protein